MYTDKEMCISDKCSKKDDCLRFNKPPSHPSQIQTCTDFHRIFCNENTNHRMYIEIDDNIKHEILLYMESGMEDKQKHSINLSMYSVYY